MGYVQVQPPHNITQEAELKLEPAVVSLPLAHCWLAAVLLAVVVVAAAEFVDMKSCEFPDGWDENRKEYKTELRRRPNGIAMAVVTESRRRPRRIRDGGRVEITVEAGTEIAAEAGTNSPWRPGRNRDVSSIRGRFQSRRSGGAWRE
ncbi:hypothetical protein TIFTF001_006734 [Ficus carica]|uniref:Uncharacterized protein n=1 Tax=Ficus carica TaxID=3494 RepID=A0AA87ZI08_FICCA|nr:hypothetical protein TIFTF001_006734 [Ficus carica]